jgi:hypothetical protein
MAAASTFSSGNMTKRVDVCVQKSVRYSYNVLCTLIYVLQLFLSLFITLYRVLLN